MKKGEVKRIEMMQNLFGDQSEKEEIDSEHGSNPQPNYASAAVGVVQKGLQPTIPKNTHPKLPELLERLWEKDPTLRPDFSEIMEQLQQIAKEVGDEGEEKKKSSTGGGIFAALRRSATHHHH